MAKDQKDENNAFRAAVLAKRLLDLVPEHRLAQEIIEAISEETHRRFPGEPHLSHIFFSKLSPNTLLHFFRNAVFRTFKRGEYICKEGDKADSMMMVVSGEIVPLIRGQRLTDPEDLTKVVVLREGEIIGEMGLFNPGEKRTATLRAQKSAITLSIDYRFLRKVEGDGDENKKRMEIQEQTWDLYCARTIQNRINTHPLFRLLSDAERRELIMNKETIFLPPHYEGGIQLEPKDVWDHWVIVVAGNVTVYTEDEHKVDCRSGDCLGPIRCVMMGRKEPVYTKVEVSPNAQLVRLSWEFINKFMNTSEAFRSECLTEGYKACQLCGI